LFFTRRTGASRGKELLHSGGDLGIEETWIAFRPGFCRPGKVRRSLKATMRVSVFREHRDADAGGHHDILPYGGQVTNKG